MFFRLSMPIECAEVFSRSAAGGLPGTGFFGPKNDLEDYDADSDFEVLMKTAHGHLAPDRTEREKDATKPELNNHKDYVQEKPSRLKQRLVAHLACNFVLCSLLTHLFFFFCVSCIVIQKTCQSGQQRFFANSALNLNITQ